MKVIKDYIYFLGEIEKLSKTLNHEQKASLENILKVQLTMLVMLKKGSNLGKIVMEWEQ